MFTHSVDRKMTGFVARIVFLILCLSYLGSLHWSLVSEPYGSGPSAEMETEEQEALIVLEAAWLMSLSSPLFNEWDASLTFHSQQPGYFIHNHGFISFIYHIPESSLPKVQFSRSCFHVLICFSGGLCCKIEGIWWFDSVCPQIVYSQAWISPI